MEDIINEIKKSYFKNKITTLFMGIMVSLAILTYLKPDATSGFLNYIGVSAFNFVLLAGVITLVWYLWARKKI